ncbi:MAG: 2Fe-2S iron-sulfur cluster-binding protein [Caulobacteraceae bacterium]
MITFEGNSIALQPGQTVLAGLEEAGVKVETSCRAGVCQSCLMQVVEGTPSKPSQQGLSPSQVARGLFMPCVCMPSGDMTVARAGDAHQRVEAEVHSLEPLSDSVLRVRLKPLSAFAYRPGQFVRLITEDGLVRSYSIASTPEVAPLVELHVRLIPGGKMSGRLKDATAPGDRLMVSGPSGGCTYEGVEPDQPLILAGAGTGLAPLWGVLNDALARRHRGPITLYHGALNAGGLYLKAELEALQARHRNFVYRPCLMDQGEDLLAVVKADAGLKGAGVYLCGDAPLVERLRKTLFLAGARLADIRADAFAAAA